MADLQRAPWSEWETVRLIGRGSFGTVYEIQRTLIDGTIETAAMKVISIPQNSGDVDELYSEGYDKNSVIATINGHLRSIVTEYSLMKKMDGCANIVNCDDVRYIQHADGIGWDVFIRMELLSPIMKVFPGEISAEEVIRIGEDICTALVLCGKHDIIHRDIKPQNIFRSVYGDYKLGDFGIAKTIERTMGGTKVGTYKYMAPEVFNNQPYGSNADIYSLGLVLYWLLNERRMPFLPKPPEKLTVGMDEEARLRRLSGEPIPAPAHGSDELKRIVLKACAYAPEERYQSADEMLEDLRNLSGRRKSGVERIASAAYTAAEEDFSDKTVGPAFRSAAVNQPAQSAQSVPEVQEDLDRTVGGVTPAAQRVSFHEKVADKPVFNESPAFEKGKAAAQFQEESDKTVGMTYARKPETASAPAIQEESDKTVGVLYSKKAGSAVNVGAEIQDEADSTVSMAFLKKAQEENRARTQTAQIPQRTAEPVNTVVQPAQPVVQPVQPVVQQPAPAPVPAPAAEKEKKPKKKTGLIIALVLVLAAVGVAAALWAMGVFAHSHRWDEGEVRVKPGVTKDGLMVYTCESCGEEREEEIPAVGMVYDDVLEGSWYYDAVVWAADNGLTKGAKDTSFYPDRSCDRALLVTLLWNAIGSPKPKTDNPFVDIRKSDYFYNAVRWAYENGIVSGVDETHFGPYVECNRAQAVTFLYRTMGNPAVYSASPFEDVKDGDFFCDAAIWAYENGISSGVSATKFDPFGACSRAQVVTLLYRAFTN